MQAKGNKGWRQSALIVGVAAVLAVTPTGCGSSSNDGPAAVKAANPAYPMTIATSHGDVTIDTAPQRIVALSFTSADELLSLGVKPMKVAADPATLAANAPWVAAKIKGSSTANLLTASYEPNVEAITQLRPDLIIAQTYQIADKALFEQLIKIAPTVTPASNAVNVDWDERLLKTAEAVNKTAEADKLIAELKDEFAAVGAAIPDISSKTYQWVRVDPDGFGFGNGSVFELFGLKPATNQDNTQNGAPLSKENTADLDADLLAVWPPNTDLRHGLEASKLFQQLPSVQNKTIYWAGLDFANAINSPGPLALRWLKDQLSPNIEALAR